MFSRRLSACSVLTARKSWKAGKAQGLHHQLRVPRRSRVNYAGMSQAPVVISETLPRMSVDAHVCLPCNFHVLESWGLDNLAEAYWGSRQDHYQLPDDIRQPARHARDDTQTAYRSIRKGAAARGAAAKSPRACSCTAAASAAAFAPVLAAAAEAHLGAGAIKETPIACKLAGKLRLGCSQVLPRVLNACLCKRHLPEDLLQSAKVSCSLLSRGPRCRRPLPERQLWRVARSGSPRPPLCGGGWRGHWQCRLIRALRSMRPAGAMPVLL